MFNACMQQAPNTGPPPGHHLGSVPQSNGPPNEPGFYSPAPPPHAINFNNQIRPNIALRPPIYEFKVYELTKRLTERPENTDSIWWDQFVTEFFDDHSTFTIHIASEEGPKQYTIGRTLIPRYFRTMYDDGVIDFSIRLKRPFIKEHPNRTAILECDQCTLITQHVKPGFNKQLVHYTGMDPTIMKENKEIGFIVTTDGRLVLEFVQDDSLRIKTWTFVTTHFQELIPKNFVAVHINQDANILDQLTKNVTRQGLTNNVIQYLRLCVLLEPMQMIMSRHKEMEGSTPRDCLKNVLYTKWQANVCAPQEQQRPQNKRRKRKSSTPNATGGGSKKKNNNTQMSPGTPNFPLATQDVMVVGEPSLMGGEFGDEDERIITRLENNQYDSNAVPTNGLDENVDFGGPNNQQQVPPQQQQSNQVPQNPQQSLSQPPSQQSMNQASNQAGNNQLNNNNGQQSIQGNGISNLNNQSIGPIEDNKKPSPISQ